MPRFNLRDESRKPYVTADLAVDGLDRDGLRTGALLRIADATEIRVRSHDALREKAERYEKWYAEANQRIRKRDRTIAALRGQVTKLKKRLAAPIDTHETP